MRKTSFITTPDEIHVVVDIKPALFKKLNLSKESINGLKEYISGESIENIDEQNYRLFNSYIKKLTKDNRFGFEDVSNGFPDNIIMYMSISKNNLDSNLSSVVSWLMEKGIRIKNQTPEIKDSIMEHTKKESANKIANIIRELDEIAHSFEYSGDLKLAKEVDEISEKLSQTDSYEEFVKKRMPEIEKKYKDKAVEELSEEWKKKM